MEEEKIPPENGLLPEDDLSPEEIEAAKKKMRINALVFGGVFMLTMILPQPYKLFAPILFLIPIILAIKEKIHRPGEQSGMSPRDPTYYQPSQDRLHRPIPYEIEPKDPKKDPRRYKPIG
jgi:hypothetical protein